MPKGHMGGTFGAPSAPGAFGMPGAGAGAFGASAPGVFGLPGAAAGGQAPGGGAPTVGAGGLFGVPHSASGPASMGAFGAGGGGLFSSTGSAVPVHDGVSCDVCGESPVRGVRYRCSMCSDYDVCDRCIGGPPGTSSKGHNATHLFLRLDKPTAAVGSYVLFQDRSVLQHPGIRCNGCSVSNFTGYRYQCQVCPDVDLCEACEQQGKHNPLHNRIKIVRLAAPAAEAQQPAFGPAVPGADTQPRVADVPLCDSCRASGRVPGFSTFADNACKACGTALTGGAAVPARGVPSAV